MKSFRIQKICDKMTILIGNRMGGSGTEEGGRVRYKKDRKKEREEGRMTILIGNRVDGSGTEEGKELEIRKKDRKGCEYQFHYPHLCLLLPTSTSSNRCHGSDYAECHKLQTLSLLFCVGEVENQNKKSTFL